MGDSDDDYDRRRGREKFQKERPEPHSRDRDRRKDFDRNRTRSDGNSWARGRRDNYPAGGDRRRDRYSNSPPHKRRRDWDDGGGYPDHPPGPPRGYGPGPYPSGPGWGPHGDLRSHLSGGPPGGPFAPPTGPPMRPMEGEATLTQPPMQPFKRFLSTQDDTISDEEAVKRYNQYKLDFKKQQINEFFLNHKDEEWFRTKYHPEDGSKRKADLHANLMCRKDTFVKLHEMGKIDTPLDIANADSIINVLDSAVVLMEGGTVEDLAALNQPGPSGSSTSQAGGDAETQANNGETPASPTSKKRRKKSKKRRKVTKDPDASSGSESDSSSSSSSDSDSSESSSDSEGELKPSSKKRQRSKSADGSGTGELEEGESNDPVVPPTKSLHRTQSIFIRTLAPTITKHEVETMCKKYPGFMRVALQDPSADRKFYRRGWVTFDKSVNIKDICWNMSNIRLRECELGAIVNRDLKQRVRPVSGLVNHKQAVKTYIKLAARVIQNMDTRNKIWEDDENMEKEDQPEKLQEEQAELGLVTKNPIMKGITDFLVDEVSLEDELLGAGGEAEGKKPAGSTELQFEIDKKMTAALDRMVWYMRIVYSVDFYNAIEYPNEHEMPHRCGIVHARGVVPEKPATQNEMNDFINHFETKVKPFTDAKRLLDDTECGQLGKKDPEQEVEKFIAANIQKLGEDKYLCPLSGKKFKGPDFVRKHIFSKHMEKVEEVKLEAQYFNNYLEDNKRPSLPEHPSNSARPRMRPPPPEMAPPQNFPPRGPMMGLGPPRMPSRGGYHGNFDSGGGYGGGRGGFGRPDPYNTRDPRRGPPPPRGYSGGNRDGRAIVGYQDLDAPDDDIF